MKRLLIIGSREFIVGTMDFTMSFAPGLSVVGLVDSATDVLEDVRQTRPDIVVLDGVADLAGAVAGLPALRAQAPDVRVVVVVDRPEHEDVARARDAGAVVCAQPLDMRTRSQGARPDPWKALQLRSVSGPSVAESVHEPSVGERAGPPVLTRREREIMGWVSSGHTNPKIARRLWVTEQTVKFHLTNIYRKLGVANRTEASHYVLRHGLVPPPDGHEPTAAAVEPTTPEPLADASVVGG
jgi:DNA-binding NarL/FixJ family response regulator